MGLHYPTRLLLVDTREQQDRYFLFFGCTQHGTCSVGLDMLWTQCRTGRVRGVHFVQEYDRNRTSVGLDNDPRKTRPSVLVQTVRRTGITKAGIYNLYSFFVQKYLHERS